MLDLSHLPALQGSLVRADFCLFCEAVLAPISQKPAAHHRLMIQELQAVADGTTRRNLALLLPPGSAKSTYGTVLFPAWFMAQRRRQSIITAANTARLAELFSGKTQDIIRDNPELLGFRLRTEAKDRWMNDQGSEYLAVGVGGNATGYRADLGLIDDPLRSRKEADNPEMRENLWTWYQSVFKTRLKPGGRQVVVQTRWHQDDLIGRLLQIEPDKWRVVNLPAEAIAGRPDALGRSPGEFLWGDDPAYPYAQLLAEAKHDLAVACATREWSSLYQQDPQPPAGTVFETAKIGVVEPLPRWIEPDPGPYGPSAAKPKRRTLRRWDLAGTEASSGRDPDYTVGLKLTRTENLYIVEDVVRFRSAPAEVMEKIRAVAELDGREVTIGLPQDPGQAGKSQISYMAMQLSGFTVRAERETGSKEVRAVPVASQVSAGTLAIARAQWNAVFMEELRDFPSGSHDDIVDSLSGAFNMLNETHGPARVQSLY